MLVVTDAGAVLVALTLSSNRESFHVQYVRKTKIEDENNYLSIRINAEIVPFCFCSIS